MDEFRFGELRERSLHKQLKALYRPDDGEAEWTVGSSIADLWSPTAGVIEIQTRSLGKLKPKLTAYLAAGLTVMVVHPLAVHRTVVTWNADRTQILRQRKSPKSERLEGAFREIGALWEFLTHPRFTLVIAEVKEAEHRCEDGKGSWRRQGRSKVDRVLEALVSERRLAGLQAYRDLVPERWIEPGTVKSLAEALEVRDNQAQAFASCLKKIGVLEVCGLRGRAHLLRRVSESSLNPK